MRAGPTHDQGPLEVSWLYTLPDIEQDICQTPVHWSLPSEESVWHRRVSVQLLFFAGEGDAGSVLRVLRAEHCIIASSHSPVQQVVLSFPFYRVIHHGTGAHSQEAGAQGLDMELELWRPLRCRQACVWHTATPGTAGGCSRAGRGTPHLR